MPTPAPRRVAIVINNAFAMHHFRGPLITAVANTGAEVFAFAPDYDDISRAKVSDMGGIPVDFPLDRTGVGIVGDCVTIWTLWHLFRARKIDVALCCFIKPAIYGTLAAKLAGVPKRVAMIEGLGYFFTERPAKKSSPGRSFRRNLIKGVVVTLLRLTLRFAHTIIFLNADDRKFFKLHQIGRPARFETIPGTGIDLARLRPTVASASPMTFLLVGRLLREKGVLEFVAAARIIKADHPSAIFRIVGGLDSNPGAIDKRDVQAWVASGLIEWPGHLDNVFPEYHSASVFVLPSWREGAPRSTQEALAAGRPVITTDVPGARETIEHGESGFIVPPHDPHALAEAMRRFLDNPPLVATMGRAARLRAEARYDERPINARLLSLMGLTD